MTQKTLIFFTAIFLNSIFIFSQSTITESNSGKRIKINNPTNEIINKVLLSGIDLRCGAIHDHDALFLEVTSLEIDNLKKYNISYDIEIDNLTEFYAERAAKDLPKALQELKLEKSKKKYSNKSAIQQKASSSISNVIVDSYLQYYGESEVNWATPSNFNLGGMGGCLTVSEMEAQLDLMRTKFPSLITVKKDASPSNMKTYGFSGTGGWSGKTIYYVKISDNPDGADDSNEPDILYTSMIHSRELSSLMGNIYFMWYLLENYATNPAIKSLVDNNELFFVPVVNPDGLKWNEKENPDGGGMNRTNLRGFSTSDPTNNSNYIENYGVDPNRNFNYLWGSAGDSSGSSGNYWVSTYRGPSAFSEPESQIMRDFVLSKNFKTAVWQHSYANAIPHPYGGIPTKVSGRENEMVRWHQDMTRYNRYIYGAQVLTPANGIADDWCLGGASDTNGSFGSGRNILATTPENGHYNERNSSLGFSGFWPTPSNIIPIAKRMMRINLMNAYYGGKYAKFHDLTQSNITSLSSNLRFGIERVGQTSSNFTLTITPISSNIQSITSPSTQTGITVLEQRNVTAALVLKNTITANEKIEYKVTLSNSDAVIYEANFVKYYNPTVLFGDDPDTDISIANWVESTNWRNTTLSAWSGTRALKAGAATAATIYASNVNNTLTTTNSFDLSGASKTIIQFYAKWDLERNYDFVELLGSTNNGTTWYNLGGKYNKPNATSVTNDSHSSSFSPVKSSTSYSFQSNQSSGLVYDGDQMDNWVMEEIVIDASINAELFNSATAKFRFNFRTDGNNRPEKYSTTYDGFYFDDFKIIRVVESTLGIEDELLSTFNVYPNPSTKGEINIKTPSEISKYKIDISTVLGQKIYYEEVNSYDKKHTISTSNFRSGIYFVTVSTDLGRATKKIIIQ